MANGFSLSGLPLLAKLSLAPLTAALIVLAILGIGSRMSGTLGHDARAIDLAGSERMRAYHLLLLAEDYLRAPDAALKARIEEQVKLFEVVLDGLRNGSAALGLAPVAEPELAAELDGHIAEWQTTIKPALQTLIAGRPARNAPDPWQAYRTKVIEYVQRLDAFTQRLAARSDERARSLTALQGGLGFVSTLIAAASLAYFYWIVVRPVRALSRAVKSVAGGNFFRQHLRVTAGDEIGELGHAFNTMLSHLQDHIGALEQSRRSLAAWSTRVDQLFKASKKLLRIIAHVDVEEDLLQCGIEALADLVQARYGAIGILGDNGALKQFVYTGISPERAQRIGRLPQGTGLLGVVIRDGCPLRLEDMSRDPRIGGFPPHHPPMKSLLAVPIAGNRTVFGRVYLCDKTNGEPFTEEDELLVSSYAGSLGLAITNLREVEERKQAQRRLEQIVDFDL